VSFKRGYLQTGHNQSSTHPLEIADTLS